MKDKDIEKDTALADDKDNPIVKLLNDPTVQEKLSKLKPADRLYIENYYNPYSSTYGNKRRSLIKADPRMEQYVTEDTKGSTYTDQRAREIINKHKVRDVIQIIESGINTNILVRTGVLGEIVTGADKRETIYYDAEGKVKGSIVSKPGSRDKIQAIKELNEMEGLKKAQEAQIELARDEFKTLKKQIKVENEK